MFGKNPFSEFRATQLQVQENKFLIPEEIPANERTAFHGAAAAAHKAGKKSFNFGGKTHPVTMKKDTANAIADQKEGYYKDMEIKKQDKEMGAKPVPSKKKNDTTHNHAHCKKFEKIHCTIVKAPKIWRKNSMRSCQSINHKLQHFQINDQKPHIPHFN